MFDFDLGLEVALGIARENVAVPVACVRSSGQPQAGQRTKMPGSSGLVDRLGSSGLPRHFAINL
jgi:hypothetical protein